MSDISKIVKALEAAVTSARKVEEAEESVSRAGRELYESLRAIGNLAPPTALPNVVKEGAPNLAEYRPVSPAPVAATPASAPAPTEPADPSPEPQAPETPHGTAPAWRP